MVFLGRARKIELLEICEELGIDANTSMKVVDLKTSIVSDDKYDEEEVKYMFERISEDRIRREEEERKEKEYKIKQEEEEKNYKKRQEEYKMRQEEEEKNYKKRQEEDERKEREYKMRQEEEDRKERMIREARQHELELKKLEMSKDLNQKNENETKTEASHKIQLHQITPKFDEKHDEMGLYLINFERRAEVPKKNWVAYLLAVLPAELSNMLAREEPNDANNYEFVKKLILKRYKLSSEKLKQCFYRHHKSFDKSWRNYAQELYSYFTEWITELNIETFQQLKDLIVTEQLKFRVPAEIRDHYLEDWMTFKTPYELAGKIDDYECIKDSFKRSKIPHTEIENKNAKGSFWEKKTNYNGNKSNTSFKAKPP